VDDKVEVTNYPYKPQKMKPREQTVIVCVLEKRNCRTMESLFLLVQRPSSGLLASLWEFPSVCFDEKREITYTEMKQETDRHLRYLLGDHDIINRTINANEGKPKPRKVKRQKIGTEDIPNHSHNLVERNYVGKTTFLFSHLKHFYQIEKMCISCDENEIHPNEENASSEQQYHTVESEKVEEEAERGKPNLRWLSEKDLNDAAIPKGMKNCFKLTQDSKRNSPKKQKTLEMFFKK